MTAWLATKALGLARGWWLLGAALALAALAWWLSAAEKADDKANREIGAQGAVISGQRTTLDQVGKANEAEDKVRRGGDTERYERCLRYATADTRANCDALRPVPD